MSGVRAGHPSTMDAEALEELAVSKIRTAYLEADIGDELTDALRLEQQSGTMSTDSARSRLLQRLGEVDDLLARARRRMVEVEDDEVAVQFMAEVKDLTKERDEVVAKLAVLEARPVVGADDPETLVAAFWDFVEHLDERLNAVSLETRKECVRACLATPSGSPGPVTLHFERHETKGGRYRGRLVRGKLGLVSPVAQALYRENGGGNRIRTVSRQQRK